MRALGESPGSRRLSEEQNSAEEPKETVRERRAPARSRAPETRGEDASAEERTSPFPYAEDFDQWVADETAAPDGRRHRSAADDADT